MQIQHGLEKGRKKDSNKAEKAKIYAYLAKICTPLEILIK